MDIVTQLHCMATIMDTTSWRQLVRIVTALLTMSGRVTMVGIARWAGKGGRYRTVQRFFNTRLPWAQLNWAFLRAHVLQAEQDYLLVGDETVVTKAGKQTHGLDRFFSSLYGRAVPGLAFFALALVSVQERRAYPLMVEQHLRSAKQPTPPPAPQPPAEATKRERGRPKGSRNRDKTQIEWTTQLTLLQRLLQEALQLIGTFLPVRYVVLDGQFGSNNALQVVRQSGLHLISKLRHDAALYLPYEGEQKQYGPRRRYGDKLNWRRLPERYRVAQQSVKGVRSETYHLSVWHKSFPEQLNVVIIVKTHLGSGAQAHMVLFTSDLTLGYEKLIDYYSLRFQIEFNFRDAKQLWGLEDFMNVKALPLTNAVNLAFFMVNLSAVLLAQLRHHAPHAGLLDLKAFFRGSHYASATLNLLPDAPDPFLSEHIIRAVAALGAIHPLSVDRPAA